VLEEVDDTENRDKGFTEVMRVTPHKAGMVEMQGWFRERGHRACRNSADLEIPELREKHGFHPRFDALRWLNRALSWEEFTVVPRSR